MEIKITKYHENGKKQSEESVALENSEESTGIVYSMMWEYLYSNPFFMSLIDENIPEDLDPLPGLIIDNYIELIKDMFLRNSNEWFEDGSKKTEIKDSRTTEWDEDGQIVSIFEEKNISIWYENGQIQLEKKSGSELFYFESGQIYSEVIFNNNYFVDFLSFSTLEEWEEMVMQYPDMEGSERRHSDNDAVLNDFDNFQFHTDKMEDPLIEKLLENLSSIRKFYPDGNLMYQLEVLGSRSKSIFGKIKSIFK